MNNYILNRTLSIFLVIQLFLIGVVSRFPQFIESYYSRGIYPFIGGFMRRLLGWIPVSVGDVLYVLLFIAILRWLWYVYETRFSPFVEQLYRMTAFISVIVFLFHFLWGMNYYRLPLNEQMGIKSLTYDSLALQQTTHRHIDKLNAIHYALVDDDTIVPTTDYSKRAIYRIAAKQYKTFKNDSLDFKFRKHSVKKSLISKPLTYMGFTGYLNPFTGEAQVNRLIPMSSYPVTVTHEMAHQLGYASESEANYIGYLACINNPDLFFQYSGELMAVRYLIKEISLYNPALAQTYLKRLNPGIQRNIQLSKDFWDSYKTPVKPISQKVYDQYLKANSQNHGLRSYNDMVGYLVNDNYNP
ncbi:MAG: amino acid permease [Flavobacteriia bacterium]|nr:MAG: amino acid permease [Flavobacteriia bacterium]